MDSARIKHFKKIRKISGDEPLITNGSPRCPYCNNAVGEPNSFVALSLAVYVDESNNSSEVSNELTICFHDAHDGMNNDENAVGKIRLWPIMQGNQQGALGLFCSTDCLRRWFNSKIDEIEDYLARK